MKTIDPVFEAVNEQVAKARVALIRLGIPGGPARCPCGGPLVRDDSTWLNPRDLRGYAADAAGVTGNITCLALDALIDDGVFFVHPDTLEVSLNLSCAEVKRIRALRSA